MALGDEPIADLAGHVCLGPADQPAVRDLPDDAIGSLGGETQEVDLVVVLDDPQVAQNERGGHEPGSG